MKIITENSVEEALYTAMILFQNHGVTEMSRNGRVISLPEPLTTVYLDPRRRVVFSEDRDCNPFLHFFESLWMLHGREDLEFLTQFTENMANFSDDGKTLNGAYGHRWRNHFEYDQLEEIVEILSVDPTSRRAVLSMWDPSQDLINQRSKDLPCNTQVMFRIFNNRLNIMVTNRSNDAIWGAYGANAVHFSFLQEYVACRVGVGMGTYTQVSMNTHIYPTLPVAQRMLKVAGQNPIVRYGHAVTTAPLLISGWNEPFHFHYDMDRFMKEPDGDWEPLSEFFELVACPMWRLWCRRKEEGTKQLLDVLENMAHCDWKVAGKEWINRRRAKAGLKLVV